MRRPQNRGGAGEVSFGPRPSLGDFHGLAQTGRAISVRITQGMAIACRQEPIDCRPSPMAISV